MKEISTFYFSKVYQEQILPFSFSKAGGADV